MLNILQLGFRTQLAQPAESGLQLGKILQLGRAPIQGEGLPCTRLAEGPAGEPEVVG